MKQLNITDINIELTNRCNLRCAPCAKRMEESSYKKTDFDIGWLDKIEVEKLNSFYICGTIGDPILYPHLIEFIEKCHKRNPKMLLSIHTNGSMKAEEWWKKLGTKLKDTPHCITFGVDGLEDTYSVYRVGGSYEKVIGNMKSFIEGGGDAVWQYIIFEHNEHQIVEAMEKARVIGCKELSIRKSFFFDEQYKRPSGMKNLLTRREFSQLKLSPIYCRIEQGEITILSDGDVIPCCHRVPKNCFKSSVRILNLHDYTLDQIVNKGYIQEIYHNRYKNKYCKATCRDTIESFGNDKFILRYLKIEKK